MIPFCLFEQVSRFDLYDIRELKNHSSFLRVFQEIISPERIGYTINGVILIDDFSYSSLLGDVGYALHEITGVETKSDINRSPKFAVSLDDGPNEIEFKRDGYEIDIFINSKSKIPEVGKLIDDLVIKDIKRGFHTRFTGDFYKIPGDQRKEIEEAVNEILVQDALSRLQDSDYKNLGHEELIQKLISRYPILMRSLEIAPDKGLKKTWLTPDQKKNLEILVKANNMIF